METNKWMVNTRGDLDKEFDVEISGFVPPRTGFGAMSLVMEQGRGSMN